MQMFTFKRSQNRRIAVMAIAVAAALGLAGTALAAQPGGPGVQVVAKGSVDQVVGQLKKMVADGGMMVMGELHQGKVLSMTGLKVQSESLFVGSPTVGKDLFSAQPGAGLVVPVRINIYQDAEGRTVVSYVPPSEQLEGFDDDTVNRIATMLDENLAKMVGMLKK
jgi:uncharacterized protein (DUF302 family)